MKIFISSYPFDKNQKIVEPDWQNYICETANAILKEQTPQNLLNVRSRLYELLCHGIPTELIFKVIFNSRIITFIPSRILDSYD